MSLLDNGENMLIKSNLSTKKAPGIIKKPGDGARRCIFSELPKYTSQMTNVKAIKTPSNGRLGAELSIWLAIRYWSVCCRQIFFAISKVVD
jgi:hypothetical protein